ncbi:MAG: hypothetical protein RH917_04375 [Lacipirellulaceae bacterium]
MVRSSVLGISVLGLLTVSPAFGIPPDQVRSSPIPSLEKPRQINTGRTQQATRPSRGIGNDAALPPWPEEASMPVEEGSVETREAKRVELWNSDRMKAARQAVMQFCRFSAKTSPKEGEQFLNRLSKLPLIEMKDWLERYEAGQQARQRGREVSAGARQQAIDRSLVRIVGQQQPGLTAATLKANHALQARFEAEERARQDASACRDCPTSDQLLYWDLTRRRYDPFEVVIDPSTPRGYARRVGAALSLPGDLSRSDPRNFIRGERGQTFLDPADAPPGERLGR